MTSCTVTVSLIIATIVGAAALTPSVVKPKGKHARGAKENHGAPEGCTCKNWKQTYQTGGISCGVGQEFFFKTGLKNKKNPEKLEEAKNMIGKTICGNFYELLDFNSCVNVNIGKDRGQWCYVDAACNYLNEGSRVPNSQLSWKMCDPEQDDMLRNRSPEDLNKTSHESDIELGMLHKMSYPLSKAWEGKRFPEVQAFWGVGDESVDTLNSWLKKDMQKIVDSGKPHSFDNSLDERTPHTIVVGKKVYTVEDVPNKDDAHPGTWETLKCIANC